MRLYCIEAWPHFCWTVIKPFCAIPFLWIVTPKVKSSLSTWSWIWSIMLKHRKMYSSALSYVSSVVSLCNGPCSYVIICLHGLGECHPATVCFYGTNLHYWYFTSLVLVRSSLPEGSASTLWEHTWVETLVHCYLLSHVKVLWYASYLCRDLSASVQY